MIKINVCNKYYNKGRGNENHVLKDVTLSLPEKGMVAIFGRSGCGKTTLLNIIGGLDTADSGSVTVGGSTISPNEDKVRNREVGYIFQNYNLNPDETCRENIADALRLCGMRDEEEIEGRVISALRAVGLEKYAKRYPGTLSGGQKQRVAIARAIVKAPAIILADEPTGNLDEQNTVMIMQLLRKIANDRLVLLVTHEANLVEYYCDGIIDLADGRIMSVRENESVGGYVDRNKNHIYLGEYEKTTESIGGVTVESYGEFNPEDIKLTVVNADGKLFLRVDSPGVHIVGGDTETQLHEGVFEGAKRTGAAEAEMDLSALTAFDGNNYGALFSLASSVKSGYRSLFGKKDKKRGNRRRGGQKFLRLCMFVFAAVFVFMTAFFGTGIGVIERDDRNINPNMIYIKLNEEESAKLSYEELYASGVNSAYTMKYQNYYHYISLDGGSFETYREGVYDTSNDLTTALLPRSLMEGARVLAGSTQELDDSSLVISRALADRILEASTVSYISEYDDLIDMNIDNYAMLNSFGRAKIAAVVEGDEIATYVLDVKLADYMFLSQSELGVVRASDYNIEVNDGEVYIGRSYKLLDPQINTDSATIRGHEFKVLGVASAQNEFIDYTRWLERNNISHIPSDAFYYDCIERDYPELERGTEEYQAVFDMAEEMYYCEYLVDYFKYMHDYCRDLVLSGCSKDEVRIFAWGCDEMVYVLGGYFGAGLIGVSASCGELIYSIEKYHAETGEYPKLSELNTKESLLKYKEELAQIVAEAKEQFYIEQQKDMGGYYSSGAYATAYVSDADYLMLAGSVGKTDRYFFPDYYYYDSYEEILALHTEDVQATEAYLRELYPYLEDDKTVEGNTFKLVTPTLLSASVRSDGKDMLWASIVALSFCFGLMCLCIYFIMRSSLLTRINEIGIYRAIGVSKKNLVFRFTVEAGVLTALTVLLGYLISSGILSYIIAKAGALAGEFVYYPPQIALIVLLVLIGGCIFFGILPVITLLSKTPAEIIAKYDI